MSESKEEIRLDLSEGVEYISTVINQKGETISVGSYKMVGLAKHCHTGQELVVYRSPTGRLLACPLAAFASRFSVDETKNPHPPEKILKIKEGSGY